MQITKLARKLIFKLKQIYRMLDYTHRYRTMGNIWDYFPSLNTLKQVKKNKIKYIFIHIFGGSFTHSSLVRSFVSLTRSLKHPKEYMLSRTSGSRSVMEKILFKHTRRGGGCSGQGSLRPLLLERPRRQCVAAL